MIDYVYERYRNLERLAGTCFGIAEEGDAYVVLEIVTADGGFIVLPGHYDTKAQAWAKALNCAHRF